MGLTHLPGEAKHNQTQVARFVGKLDNTLKQEEIELATAGTSHKVENKERIKKKRV